MELLRLKCPGCHSADIKYHSPYATKNHGGRVIYKCENCPVYFSETKKTLMEGLKTPVSVIWQVIKARTEGMGFHAAARTFNKELVASFQECRRYAPWRWWTPRAADGSDAVRKMRGTPRQSVGRHAREHRMFYPRAPEVRWPHKYAFSIHTSRGSGDWQNSQPVRCLHWAKSCAALQTTSLARLERPMASACDNGYRPRRRAGMRCSKTPGCQRPAPCWIRPITPSTGNCS